VRTKAITLDVPYQANEALLSDIALYQQSLINVAYRIIHDFEGAKDIVQDAFVKVLENRDGFKEASSIKTYLYRMVINRSIDSKRRNGRWLKLADILGQELPVTHSSIENTIADRDLVCKLLDKLPIEFRIPLILLEVDHLSYEEIADTLGLSVKTVGTRIFRAREQLKKAFTKLEGV
jgi:RNA polymerase sigma-70 factor (ECF subfamily)